MNIEVSVHIPQGVESSLKLNAALYNAVNNLAPDVTLKAVDYYPHHSQPADVYVMVFLKVMLGFERGVDCDAIKDSVTVAIREAFERHLVGCQEKGWGAPRVQMFAFEELTEEDKVQMMLKVGATSYSDDAPTELVAK